MNKILRLNFVKFLKENEYISIDYNTSDEYPKNESFLETIELVDKLIWLSKNNKSLILADNGNINYNPDFSQIIENLKQKIYKNNRISNHYQQILEDEFNKIFKFNDNNNLTSHLINFRNILMEIPRLKSLFRDEDE